MKPERIDDRQPLRQRIRRWTRNAVIVSLLVHLGFAGVSGFIVALRHINKPQAQFIAPPPARPQLDPRKLEMKVKVQDLQKQSARPKLQPRLVSLSPTDLVLPEIKTDPQQLKQAVKPIPSRIGMAGMATGIGGGLGTGAGGGMGVGIKLPSMMSARCNVQQRTLRLDEAGGSAETEEAVMRTLRWLQKTQNSDGSWGQRHVGAMTGLALLVYLAHCETPESPEFGTTVRKAIDWLVATGESSGGSLSGGQGHLSYQHGIATYALAEAYAMTKMAKIAPVLTGAAGIIIRGQGPSGGWNYTYSHGDSDMSVNGWQIQALKSVHLGGLRVEGLEECLDKAIDGILKSQRADGAFPYRQPSDPADNRFGWNLTGVGVLALEMWKHGGGKESRKGADHIMGRVTGTSIIGLSHSYALYYNTLAVYMRGGSDWRKWNRAMRRDLLRAQQPDGSWPANEWSQSHAGEDAAHMDTCFYTLMLEVYYRFLPTTN